MWTSIKKNLSVYLSGAITLVGIALLVYALIRGGNGENTNVQPPLNINLSNTTIVPVETDFDKYSKLVQKGNYVEVNNREVVSPKFTPNDVNANNQIALDFLQKNSFHVTVNKAIISGYLYIEAGSDIPTNALLDKESLYIYLSNGNNGGHIYKPKSLEKSLSENGLTQYLFKLEEVDFTHTPYSDSNQSYSANWLTTLSKPGTYSIGGFVSTTKFGKITKIVIAFDGDKNSLKAQ